MEPGTGHRVYVTRQVQFDAAHRLYREDYSEERNWEIYGKCANRNGHGHTYTLEAPLSGEINPRTDMVEHFARIKPILHELVVEPLDHRNLNLDVPFLEGIVPTLENVVVVLWERIEKAIGEQSYQLHKLKLGSTPRSWVEYFGPMGKP